MRIPESIPWVPTGQTLGSGGEMSIWSLGAIKQGVRASP